MTETLFGTRLRPLTDDLSFVRAPAEEAARAFVAQQAPVLAEQGATLAVRAVRGTLEELLGLLPPLGSRERRRFLFVPTASTGWTALFNNGLLGNDAFSHTASLCRGMGTRGLRACYVEDAARSGGPYGVSAFQVYSDHPDGDLPGVVERTVEVLNDGGRWRFVQDGRPQPYEDTTAYQARRVRDRLPLALLERYLAAEGVAAFDPASYAPDGVAHLVEKQGPVVAGQQDVSLQEAQARV